MFCPEMRKKAMEEHMFLINIRNAVEGEILFMIKLAHHLIYLT